MSDVKSLTARVEAEFSKFQEGAEQFQLEAKREYEARESRFRDLFLPASRRVVELARPRLNLLVERFKDRVQVSPVVQEHLREVKFEFNSPLARVGLTFRLSHDLAVRNLVLDYQLAILPILMKFEDHSTLTMPLDKIEDDEIAKWFDDQIVKFVQTVAALYQNQYYLKGHLVADPIAGVQLPKYAAKATLEADGTVYYFISDETKSEFEKRRAKATK